MIIHYCQVWQSLCRRDRFQAFKILWNREPPFLVRESRISKHENKNRAFVNLRSTALAKTIRRLSGMPTKGKVFQNNRDSVKNSSPIHKESIELVLFLSKKKIRRVQQCYIYPCQFVNNNRVTFDLRFDLQFSDSCGKGQTQIYCLSES